MYEPIILKDLSNAIDTAMQSTPETLKAKLNTLKIRATDVFAPPQIAWSMYNATTNDYSTLGTLGDFSLIIGKAKSRKSFFINIAISTAISNDLILERFKGTLPQHQNQVLYFDTEQSKYFVQLALQRICKQVNVSVPDNLHVYGLRSQTPQERLELIEFAIYENPKVGMVVIDGIKDLVTSINDESEATMITSKLLKWTEERNIHIVTVLHQNKGDTNARGHIGTELINKAETVLSITKAETDNNISIVEPQQCRNKEPETFAFEINEFGLPIIAEDFEIRTATKKQPFDIVAIENYKKFQLLTEVFSKGDNYSFKLLETQIGLAFQNQFKKQIGINAIGKLILDCKNNGWLIQEAKLKPYTLGTFSDSQINNENDSEIEF